MTYINDVVNYMLLKVKNRYDSLNRGSKSIFLF